MKVIEKMLFVLESKSRAWHELQDNQGWAAGVVQIVPGAPAPAAALSG